MVRNVDLGLLTLICAIWAGNYFVVKGALEFVDPITLSFLRASLGGVLIFAIGGYALRGMRRSDYLWLALIGLFNVSLFLVLLNVALTTVAPGVASTLVYTQPVFVAMLSPLIGEKLTVSKIVGILAAFGGVVVVFESSLASFTPVIGDVYALLAAVSWALSTVLFKRSTKHYNSYVVTSVQLLAGSIFILPAFALGGTYVTLNLPFLLYLSYNVVLATGFGYVLYFRILSKMPASQFASYLFLVHIFTQFMASLLSLAVPSWNIILGTALVAIGIVAANR